MSLKLRPGHRVFVFKQYVDMRSGFDRLSMLVREQMKMKLVDGDFFIFIGKNRKRLKGLCYDGTGLLLIAKRLEQGRFMTIEALENEEITVEELDWLLRGSVIKRTKFGEEALTKRENPTKFSINYCLNHWQGLTHFLTDLTVPLTNNDAERALRHAVMGRKNFLESKTINGADTMAALYTVIETTKKNSTQPEEYLKYLITEHWYNRKPMTPKQYADRKLGVSTKIKWPARDQWKI